MVVLRLVTSRVIFGSSRVIWSKFLVGSSRVTRVTVQISMGRVTENQSSHSLDLKSSHKSSLATSLVVLEIELSFRHYLQHYPGTTRTMQILQELHRFNNVSVDVSASVR